MAQAQLIQGTGEELIAYLEQRREQANLLLIIPEEATAVAAETSYPEGAALRNGVPLFPIAGRTQTVTMAQVKALEEEA